MFFKKKNKNGLEEITKSNTRLKIKRGCKKNLSTIIVMFVLIVIFFGYQIIYNANVLNLDIDNLFYDIDINEKLTNPFNDSDLANAKVKLNDVNLTTLASQYIISNLNNNTDIPNGDLCLTNEEFASLLVPIFYAKYGKATTIYEICITIDENSDDIYKIKITSSEKIDFRYYSIKINEILYITEYYELNLNQNELYLTDFDMLNVNTQYIKKGDIKQGDSNDNFIAQFLNYVFLKNETSKSYIEQLNYTSFACDVNQMIYLKL